ncbi:probable serine/threonine-protein kinase DDB_G0282963 [Chelonus insularis]|uniref:probable serine/threonine-protein kinase DDB_G0282963 n=1 Tax=Chelonus insularis TaxID=460826 RepID=UPI001588F3D7|nr:probable serine/threonine-protein kinase DDB_G0282963 [Chelonus insularis]
MAYVNVAEWKTEQVCEWLKGLDNSVLPYVHSFTNNRVNGQQLLSLRPEDLEQLGVLKLGHQEIIIEAVEYLRNFHYELDRENLQLLALRLSCQAHSLHNELCRQTGSKPLSTQALSDVVAVMSAVKPLVRWLDRPPFSGQLEYNDKRNELLKLSIEIATCAQRERFAVKPIEAIRNSCGQLAKLADYIIQDISDPMILQPSSLDLATLKKRPGDELGFYILPSFHGSHQITDIKFSSAAHQCGKMEDSDEIVQVNYQTVVGWERKNVLELFNECPSEILLTLKRRPKHTKVFGQIYIKPYRLPSNKKTPYTTRWQHNLPSPRPELLTIPDFTIPLPRHTPKDPSPEPSSIIDTVNMLNTMVTDSSGSDSESEPNLSERLYAPKPRNLVQRRATITGASPTTKHAVDIELLWKELKQEHNTTFQLRDKAASCAHGLDNVPSSIRPQTCLGIEPSKRRKKTDEPVEEKKVQFNEKLNQIKTNSLPSGLIEDEVNQVVSNGNVEVQKCIKSDTALSVQSNNNDDNDNNNNGDIEVPSTICKKISNTNNHSSSDNVCESAVVNQSSHTDCELTNISSTNIVNSHLNNVNNNSELMDESKHALNFCSIITINKTDNDVITDDDIKKEIINTADNNNLKDMDVDYEANLISNLEGITNENIYETEEETGMDFSEMTKSSSIISDNKMFNTLDYKIDDKQESTEIISNHNINNNINTINDDFNSKCNINGNVIESLLDSKNCVLNRESSEDKSESTSSYLESIYSSSSSSEVNTLLKIEKIQDSILPKLNETNISKNPKDDSDKCTNMQVPLDHSSPLKLDNIGKALTIKDEGPRIVERNTPTKVKQTPPEPPPRKYFTRPAPLSVCSSSNSDMEYQEKPKIPDRSDIRKKEKYNERFFNYESISNFQESDSYDIFHNPKTSRDTINGSTSSMSDHVSLEHIDHLRLPRMSEKKIHDDKSNYDKYQLFTEKFGGSINSTSPITQSSSQEFFSRPVDSPDGSGFSRQSQTTPELKPRTLDKDKNYDKGVVNRAMMVARSIGLHSSSKLSSGSPKSSRKRNMLLARRRNVSVKDIAPGDLEGWLTYRSRGAGGAWARSWFILKGSSLYRFKNQESTKSDCLIVLPGFTASQASEVKSRKYAFKVYHTGTVFYFAADAEDTLTHWLDSINKATFGVDSHNRTSGLFSETDESDTETKVKVKSASTLDCKNTFDKTFGSLKKVGRKDSSGKSHESSGASLDRKYLKFLGSRTHNVPVPTAQFRSYRRVLPSSTSNKKPETPKNSQDVRANTAGSSFFSLSSSKSAMDVPNTSQDMGDYRQTTDRLLINRNRRPDDLRGFVTLEEFMLSHQSENQRMLNNNGSTSSPTASSSHDHFNYQHRSVEDNNIIYGQSSSFKNGSVSNGMIYGHPRNGEELPINTNRTAYDYHPRNLEDRSINENQVNSPHEQRVDYNSAVDKANEFSGQPSPVPRMIIDSTNKLIKRIHDNASYYPEVAKEDKFSLLDSTGSHRTRTNTNDSYHSRNEFTIDNSFRSSKFLRDSNRNDLAGVTQPPLRRYVKDNGYSGSSGDLSCCTSSETLQRAKKEASVSRKASFNLNDRRCSYFPPERHWMDSLRRSDKKSSSSEISRLKNVAQYQPPPIPSSPFDQEGSMRAAFEMHLDKSENVQKTSRLKSFFGSKSPQKSTSDSSRETQKTLLGSPRLHRALFRDKNTNQRSKAVGQCSNDNSINQPSNSYNKSNQSFSSTNDWNRHLPVTSNIQECTQTYEMCQKKSSHINANLLMPPTLPYIPPPTSPPPDDYPGLEYPPVFEPGTYSLSDASLLRNRSKKNQRDSSE